MGQLEASRECMISTAATRTLIESNMADAGGIDALVQQPAATADGDRGAHDNSFEGLWSRATLPPNGAHVVRVPEQVGPMPVADGSTGQSRGKRWTNA